jgi:hypothetical protein
MLLKMNKNKKRSARKEEAVVFSQNARPAQSCARGSGRKRMRVGRKMDWKKIE